MSTARSLDRKNWIRPTPQPKPPAYPPCPHCGEHGEPRTVTSREYQGESPHGGMVEWQEEMCSECIAAAKSSEVEALYPVDRRVCVCGRPVGEHDLGEDWVLRAPGCAGFKERKP